VCLLHRMRPPLTSDFRRVVDKGASAAPASRPCFVDSFDEYLAPQRTARIAAMLWSRAPAAIVCGLAAVGVRSCSLCFRHGPKKVIADAFGSVLWQKGSYVATSARDAGTSKAECTPRPGSRSRRRALDQLRRPRPPGVRAIRRLWMHG